MKVLVVGGTGGIGGFIALQLEQQGHDVTVASRNRPNYRSPIAHLPFLKGDYVAEEFTKADLQPFENIVFAAGVYMVPPGLNEEETAAFYHNANSLGVPRFVKLAKEAGAKAVAHIGSFYPQARPDLVAGSSYIQSRKAADEGARALADANFRVISLNAPWVIGAMKGSGPGIYRDLARYARGQKPELPVFAIPGGVNFISVEALSEATIASFTKGKNGTGYLVGDENLSFKEFFGMFFKAVGRGEIHIPVRDEPHPVFLDAFIIGGRTTTIFYENQGVHELGYRQKDIFRAIKTICDGTPL